MKIEFTELADADLIDCYLYGASSFGLARADRYERELRHVFDLIADHPRLAPERMIHRFGYTTTASTSSSI